MLGRNGFVCSIGDTGPLGLCALNFEFFKNTSIFLFYVSIFYKGKVNLKQINNMKQLNCFKMSSS